jgi:hypothetical protein
VFVLPKLAALPMGGAAGVSYRDPLQESRAREPRQQDDASLTHLEDTHVNNIVWLVGAVVIILAILGFLGLR